MCSNLLCCLCLQVLGLCEVAREEELLLQELALQVTRQCKVRHES